jgi:hypothetical protein
MKKLVLVLIIFGCSSTNTIVKREYTNKQECKSMIMRAEERLAKVAFSNVHAGKSVFAYSS